MKGLKRFLSILLIGGLLPLSGFAAMQGQRQTSDNPDVERLRIQAEDQARQEAEQRDWETKIFSVRYVDLLQLRNALSMFRARMQSSPELHVLSVKAPKEIMPAIEDAIKRLDVPQPPQPRKEAELTIYVVLASDQPETAPAIPSVLNPVLNQLKSVLSYKGYKLLDTLITRSGNTFSTMPTRLDGTIALSENSKPSYGFSASFQIVNPDGKGQVLRLDNMSFQLSGMGVNARVASAVEIPQGQQVVVGKATLGDRALILIMSAKFD
ncbi:MAG TPA: hypothetical protein VGK48_02040 [Terriglobia bacterium]